MKKTLVALAALAATASFAQVTLSGRVAMGVSSYSATGATAGAASDVATRTKVDDYSSRLRFAVNEDLGGGLRAFAAYEFGLNYDTGTDRGQSGAAPGTASTGNTGFSGSRESHLGIGNNLMEVRVGRQNVYWTQGDLSDAGANYLGKDAFSDLYTRNGVSTRQNNAILLNLNSGAGAFAGSQLYWAPEVSSESAPVGSPSATQTNNASTWGARLNWDQGKVHAMADYQKRTNIAGAVGGADDFGQFPVTATSFDVTSIKLGAGYRYAEGSMVSLHYWDLKKEFNDATANAAALGISGTGGQNGGGWKQTGYGVNLKHNLGNGLSVYALYGVLNNVNATAAAADLADSGTRTYTLGLRKDLSKRTGIFTAYGRVVNEDNATHNPSGGGFVPVTTRAGSDPTFFLVGMMHNF